METNELYLKTLFCCSACDGEMAPEEIDLVKGIVAGNNIFNDIDAEAILNKYVDELNSNGLRFLKRYLDELSAADLTDEEQLMIVKLAVDMILADEQVLYSEVKFFKRIRNILSLSDEAISVKYSDQYPLIDDLLLPDNIEPIEMSDWNYSFNKISFNL